MIEVKGLAKTYGELEALREVSFSINRGEIVGFLGPNGAGKSTTMKILTGYLPQTAGTVTVDGKDIGEDSLSVRARIGYLPESTPLYTEMLVYDYLAYVARIRSIPKAEIHERIVETTRLCGLEERLGQEIGTLSKGYKQRVGLAQALLHRPDILILDEPTSGLDPNQIVEIRNLIKNLGEDRTIILSTHNLPEVMATCSRMLIVHNGTLVADGTPADLQAREEENPRVRVVYRGAEPADLNQLQSLNGVESVDSGVTVEAGAVAFEVSAEKGHDVRPGLMELAASNGWELVEIHRLVLDLEGIFRKLTKDV